MSDSTVVKINTSIPYFDHEACARIVAHLLRCVILSAGSERGSEMLKDEKFAIDDIYVPVKRRSTLDLKKVEAIAQNMLEVGQRQPILLRRDGARFVLVEGLHRLEACKALGETKILGILVQARRS